MTPHGRLYARLEQLWECAGLTTLWVAACVPVITAGSSTLALLRVVAERREGIYRPVVRAFWDELVRAPLARAAATVATLLAAVGVRSEEHTSELQSRGHLVCRLLLEKKKTEQTAE